MQQKIKEFNKSLQKQIDEKYPDDYNRTIMMDDQVTAAKNVIVRKIKFFKQKKLNLPNFIRKTRQEILDDREEADADAAYHELQKLKTTTKRYGVKAYAMKAEVTS